MLMLVLSEDDKKWIDERLDQLLERFETRLLTGFLDQRLELTGLMDQKLERLETKLLTAFHNWASPIEARHRSHSALLRALDLEVEQLDDRLKKLEPPPNQPS